MQAKLYISLRLALLAFLLLRLPSFLPSFSRGIELHSDSRFLIPPFLSFPPDILNQHAPARPTATHLLPIIKTVAIFFIFLSRDAPMMLYCFRLSPFRTPSPFPLFSFFPLQRHGKNTRTTNGRGRPSVQVLNNLLLVFVILQFGENSAHSRVRGHNNCIAIKRGESERRQRPMVQSRPVCVGLFFCF